MDIYRHKKAKVFVSYARADRALVANFVEQLQDAAIEAAAFLWLDRELEPASSWDAEILDQLREADVILVLASSSYMRSSYCVEKELPLARECHDAGTATLVIRIRECVDPRSDLDGLETWPPAGRPLEQLSENAAEFRALRNWLKLEICKALVARHSNRFGGRSREEALKLDPDLPLSRRDDLEELHEALGEPELRRTKAALAVAGGAAWGLVGGAGLRAWVLSGPVDTMLMSVALCTGLGCFAAAVKPVFRDVELMLDSLHPGEDGLRRVQFPRLFELKITIEVSAIQGVVLGILFGVPLGLALFLGSWSLDPSALLVGIAGGALSMYAGFDFAMSFRPTRLRVFTDVAHLYQYPKTEPLPFHRDPWYDPEVPDPDDELEGAAPEELAEEPEEPEEEPERTWRPPHSNEVPVPLTIVASSKRPEETEAMLQALRSDRGDDVFRMEVVTELDPHADDPNRWAHAVDYHRFLVVLVTSELAASEVPAAIESRLLRAASSGYRRLFPVFVDDLEHGAPLTSLQGLPSDVPVVRDWPVRSNAWTNVARSLLAEADDPFRAKLDEFLDDAVFQELVRSSVERTGQRPCEVELLDRMRDVTSGDVYVDPGFDRLYPYRHWVPYSSLRRALLWIVAGALCFGLLGAGVSGEVQARWRAETRAAAEDFADMLERDPELCRSMGQEFILALAEDLAEDGAQEEFEVVKQWVERSKDDPRVLIEPLSLLAARRPLEASTLDWLALVCIPGLGFLCALGFLVRHDTVEYARLRKGYPPRVKRPRHLGHRDISGPVKARTRRVLVLPAFFTVSALGIGFGICGAVGPSILETQLGLLVALAGFGGSLGLGTYLVSRYRVPAAFLMESIPTPHSIHLERRGLRLALKVPQVHYGELNNSKIGGLEPSAKPLAPVANQELEISVWSLLRILVESAAVIGIGLPILGGLTSAGLHEHAAALVSLFAMSLLLQWLHVSSYRWGPQQLPRWRAAWRELRWRALHRATLGSAVTSFCHYLIVLLPALVVWDLVSGDVPFAVPIAVVAVTTAAMRLFDHVALTLRSNWNAERLQP